MNLDDLQQRVRWRLVTFLAVIAAGLFILDVTNNLDNAFGFLRDPVSAVMSWTAARTDAFAAVFGGPSDLQAAKEEIDALQARVDALEKENEALRELQGEYLQLRDLFDQTETNPQFTFQVAAVVGRDTSPFFRSIIIDKGSDDGIFVGMPVDSPRGMVGQVYRTTSNSAQVLLLTDNLSSIPGRLVDSRATGVVHGDATAGGMNMDWIGLEADVTVGEVVMTSGLGGRFPPDLILGRVTQVNRQEAALFQTAVVQPAVDIDRLEVVFIITDYDPVDTSVFDTPDNQ